MPNPPYTPTTQPQPETLPVGSSIPPAAGTYQQRVDGWNKFLEALTNPGLANSVLTFGLNALQGPAPGQTQQGKIAQSLGQGLNAYTQGKQQLIDQSAQEQEIARRNAATRDAQARTAEVIRSNKADEELRRQQMQATQGYYDTLAKNAKAKGALSWDDALNISRQSLQSQIKEMGALLQIMDPSTPEGKLLNDEFNRVQNNYNELLQQRARAYMGEAEGNIVSRTLSPETVSLILQRYGDTEETRRKIMDYTNGAAALPSTTISPEENTQIDQAIQNAQTTEQGNTPTAPTVDDRLQKYRLQLPDLPQTPAGDRTRTKLRNAIDEATTKVKKEFKRDRLIDVDEQTLRLALEGDLSDFEKQGVLDRLEALNAQ